MKRKVLGLLGAGGQAVELADYCDAEIAFFAVNKDYLSDMASVSVEAPPTECLNVAVIAAVGAPAIRRSMIEEWPGDQYATVVAPTAYLASSASIGEGSVVAPQAAVMAETVVGRHVLINTAAVVSHQCRVGDYVTISPGVKLGGNCTVADGVFIGIGATILPGISIGLGAVIGAGAVVLSDVEALHTVVGTPARLLRIASEWCSEV